MTHGDDPWPTKEPPPRGPSAPPGLRFDPLATAIGVFAAVAIPIVVVGYTRPAGSSTPIIVIGLLIGLIVGILAGMWVARRGGDVWKGPQL